LSEDTLLVGKKGEIYTDEALRRKAGIRKGGRVRAIVEDGKLIIEPVPSIEELILSPLVTVSPKKAEELSEEAQKEEGVFG
jgi:bifunctional DNA-binding transcriptional regulator/antitoxin component of YhaV-PrlF toxin-antitoxin module